MEKEGDLWSLPSSLAPWWLCCQADQVGAERAGLKIRPKQWCISVMEVFQSPPWRGGEV